jgi:hypothetical protein
MEAEIEVSWPQTKEASNQQKPEEQRNHACSPQKEHRSIDIMILYFWPAVLGEIAFLLL